MKYEQFQEIFVVRNGKVREARIMHPVEEGLWNCMLASGVERDYYDHEIFTDRDKANQVANKYLQENASR